MKYGFIGFGNLAQAIYSGLKDINNLQFAYFDKIKKENNPLSVDSLDELVSFSDVLFLCVKPQNIVEVLEQLKDFDLKNKIIISPVAGKSISFIENFLSRNVSIIRIMPNLAVSYKKSVTAYCLNGKENILIEKVKNDLEKLGKTVELPEKYFHLFTAVFGSGPAFILEFLKVFKNKISEMEISEEEAKDLLLGLITGTTSYLENNRQRDISELIENIKSKGGTTEAGLNYFKDNNLGKLVEGILVAAENRSKELGE